MGSMCFSGNQKCNLYYICATIGYANRGASTPCKIKNALCICILHQSIYQSDQKNCILCKWNSEGNPFKVILINRTLWKEMKCNICCGLAEFKMMFEMLHNFCALNYINVNFNIVMWKVHMANTCIKSTTY